MPRDENSFEFEQVGIADVLKRYRLSVPANQRDYAWDREQVENLLEDVTLALEQDEGQHFLGTIVTIRSHDNALEVTDGQQRLATTALVFAAMRNIVGAQYENLGKLIDAFLTSVDPSRLELKPNITLNRADDTVFHSLIVSGEPGAGFVANRASHQLLLQAYNLSRAHLKQLLKPLPEGEKWSVFQSWILFLQNRAKVILLIVSSAANSFRMFETLNDRGLKVSQADLVKNYLFGKADEETQQAQQSWASMKATLEALDDEDIVMNFLRHALITTHGFLQQKHVYDRIQRTARGQSSSISMLNTWEALSTDYVALSNPESTVWNRFPNEIRKNIQVLNLFNIAPLKPLLLAASNKMPPAEAAKVFERSVAIGVRLIIASRTTTQSVEKPLGDVASRVWTGDLTTAKAVMDALASAIPNDQQFKDAFATATVSKAHFARYYLRTLERAAQAEKAPWLIPNDNPSEINLEHVLPLKPMDNWPDWDTDEIKAFGKRIGNMALLKTKLNSDIRSASFSSKAPKFKESPYELTKSIGDLDTWRPEQITERQQTLAKLAVKAWPLK